jgi:hypothetical protein
VTFCLTSARVQLGREYGRRGAEIGSTMRNNNKIVVNLITLAENQTPRCLTRCNLYLLAFWPRKKSYRRRTWVDTREHLSRLEDTPTSLLYLRYYLFPNSGCVYDV